MEQASEGDLPRRGVPREVVVVGGTHGNERGGVWTVRNLLADPDAFAVPGLKVQALIANPAAVERNLRYLDRDLNRCFGPDLTAAAAQSPQWETRRALELRDRIQPGGISPDLVVDLHNTTCSMSITWILTDMDPLLLWLARNAQRRDHRVRILHTPESSSSNVFLPSLGDREITLEIGPVPHGTESHWAWEAAQSHVKGLLQDLSSVSVDFDATKPLRSDRFEFFRTVSVERYPEGCLIHREAAGRDYQEFVEGDPLFLEPRTGNVIHHRGEPMHPVFLGEAAYVESGIAYHATRRHLWTGASGEPC
jgi:aspartoacylase